MASTRSGRFRELIKTYGKVALGVHLSVSAVSITALYVAIRSNVDIESILHRFQLGGAADDDASSVLQDNNNINNNDIATRNRMAHLATSSGGALTLAVLCNKALFPIRVPITVALTPPISRFLARRNIIKTGT